MANIKFKQIGVDKVTRSEYESKTKERREMVYQLHKSGHKVKEIADMTGYSEAYVDHLIRKTRKPMGRRTMSDADREKAIALHKDHKTLKEIADVIGFSQSAVQKCIKDYEDAEKEKNPDPPEEKTYIMANAPHTSIQPGTVIYEIINEKDGEKRKVKWIFEKQYRNHATFCRTLRNGIVLRRSFQNTELFQRKIIFPKV